MRIADNPSSGLTLTNPCFTRREILELDENRIKCRELPSNGRVSEPVETERSVLWSLAEVERDRIKRVLQQTGWDLGEACGILGISRPTRRKKVFDFWPRFESERTQFGLKDSFND
jgi:hypothetical protein